MGGASGAGEQCRLPATPAVTVLCAAVLSPARQPARLPDGPDVTALCAAVPLSTACRRPEEAPRYHKEKQISLYLNMTSQFSFSRGASAKQRRKG